METKNYSNQESSDNSKETVGQKNQSVETLLSAMEVKMQKLLKDNKAMHSSLSKVFSAVNELWPGAIKKERDLPKKLTKAQFIRHYMEQRQWNMQQMLLHLAEHVIVPDDSVAPSSLGWAVVHVGRVKEHMLVNVNESHEEAIKMADIAPILKHNLYDWETIYELFEERPK